MKWGHWDTNIWSSVFPRKMCVPLIGEVCRLYSNGSCNAHYAPLHCLRKTGDLICMFHLYAGSVNLLRQQMNGALITCLYPPVCHHISTCYSSCTLQSTWLHIIRSGNRPPSTYADKREPCLVVPSPI